MRYLIAAWNSLPTNQRIYLVIVVAVVLIAAMLLGYGAQALAWLV